MFFTKEDYEKIAGYLKAAGVRDTDILQLNLALHPLTGEETLVIVKDGANVRVTLNDIYTLFPLLAEIIIENQMNSTIGIFNVSKYGTNLGAFGGIADAIAAVPVALRRPGLYITYYDESDNWHTYQMIGQSVEEEWNVEHFVNYHKDLQDQLDTIINSNATITLFTASLSIIDADSASKSTQLTLRSSTSATLWMTGGNIDESKDTPDDNTLIINVDLTSTTTYTGHALFGSTEKTKQVTVYVVNHIKYGAMMEYSLESMHTFSNLVTTPALTYTINIPQDGGYIYLYIPTNVKSGNYNLSMQLLSGPFTTDVDMELISEQSDNNGKLWKSVNHYDTGTFLFKAIV